MRKVTLVAAVGVLLLFSGKALAGTIVGTAHDLSTGSGGIEADVVAEICIFCHTPHGANVGVDLPLWNRINVPDTTGYTIYTSATLDATYTKADYGAGVTGACLSCHDATTALDSLVNFPGALTSGSIDMTGVGTGANDEMTGIIAAIGPNFGNDHPVAFKYEDARTAEAIRLGGPAQLEASVAGTPRTVSEAGRVLPLFARPTAGDDWLECATCHNVHNPTAVPFLRFDNAASALCLVCHLK